LSTNSNKTKRKIRGLRNFLIGLGLVSMVSTRGRAFVYEWTRMRQRRAEEEEKKRKKASERMDRLMRKRKK